MRTHSQNSQGVKCCLAVPPVEAKAPFLIHEGSKVSYRHLCAAADVLCPLVGQQHFKPDGRQLQRQNRNRPSGRRTWSESSNKSGIYFILIDEKMDNKSINKSWRHLSFLLTENKQTK